MKPSFKFFAAVSLSILASSCRPAFVTPLQAPAFEACANQRLENNATYESTRAKATFYLHEEGGRTVTLHASLLAAWPDQFYMEVRAFGVPATIVSYSGEKLVLYQAHEKKAYVAKHADSLNAVLQTDMPWKAWIGLFLSKLEGASVLEFYQKDCAAKKARLPSGEWVEWGARSGGKTRLPSFVKVSWKNGWVKWDYASYEGNFTIPKEWFEISLPPNVLLLENPSLLR